jgi:Family of unknown function (DUF6057)
MQIRPSKNFILFISLSAIFFVVYFIYFRFFNCYHLLFQEQTHLFLYDMDYFNSFFRKPGGLSTYMGAFLIQFCNNPASAAIIVTIPGILLFCISVSILKNYHIQGIIWSIVPAILLAALQSHQLYSPGTSVGLLFSSLFFLAYISVKNHKYRYPAGIAGCILLYFIAGSLMFLAVVLCIIHELVFANKPGRFIAGPLYIIIAFLVPVISSKLIFYINTEETWLSLLPLDLKRSILPFLFGLLLYFPVLLICLKLWGLISKVSPDPGWNWKNITAGMLGLASLSFLVIRYAYDAKAEILLRIDHYAQEGEWKKALEYSFVYPGTNQLVLYYGNMAMFKTGQMGDKMFHLPQTGINGLLIGWRRNEIAPFFGGEVFYQLGYISEAYRWAFEAMEAMGQNPRSLKRLVVTSIIRNDDRVAQHYINILKETLFYRKWAEHYQELLDNPELQAKDNEITEKRHFQMHTDILASLDGRDVGLLQMLEDHPDNKMAFEYYMASLLLTRDLDKFAENIFRLKDLGYSSIPVHYEEAMLAYMDHTKKNIVPEGYSIRRETIDRLSGFVEIINSSSSRNSAARSLYRDYGGTYWFYMNFATVEKK